MLNEPADKLAFDKLVTLLKPGGLLLMNLPTGKLFKGTHDIAVGIAKRYTKAHIKKACSKFNRNKRNYLLAFPAFAFNFFC